MYCLKSAGLSSVEYRGGGIWRGDNLNPFFTVIVQKVASPSAARKDAKVADLVHAAAAGRYLVTGPSRGTNDRGITALVASCLRP